MTAGRQKGIRIALCSGGAAWPVRLAALLWLALCVSCSGNSQTNIILILIETLRADHVACYGYGRPTTPALDRMAAEGVRFEQAIAAASWTMPSVASLFTSLVPSLHGLTNHQCSLAEGVTTLAAELKQAGYQTAGIVSTPSVNGRFGFSRGFDFYDDSSILFTAALDLPGGEGAGAPPGIHTRPTADKVTRLAETWLREKREPGRPFFLHLFYFDPHYDYAPPSPYDAMFTDPDYAGAQDGRGIPQLEGRPLRAEDRRQIVGLYDGEIRFTDDQVGALLATLGQLQLADRTLVIVAGDHGEEFWEHGGVTHGHTLYEELVRVPLILRCPGLIRSGRAVSRPVSLMDVMPTVLDLVGAPIPAQCQGRSLRNLLAGAEDGGAERPCAMETSVRQDLLAMRTAGRKIIERRDGSGRQLYSLSDDPGECRNLAGTARAAEFGALDREFRAWKERIRAEAAQGASPASPQLDPRLLQILRSLRYAQ